MSSPPPKSLVPSPTVWPPSNPSGTVIPFPLPWVQAGCCPPGGLDALMKCYCDIQQASAFIGQIMLDQINNNPAIIAAIIAGIENSGSTLPTLGVTNGTDAQPGQVGEWVRYTQSFNITPGNLVTVVNMGVLQPGDWDCWAWLGMQAALDGAAFELSPVPAGFSDTITQTLAATMSATVSWMVSFPVRALTSVPSLLAFNVTTNLPGSTNSQCELEFAARRRR